jgi:hypothetical protein
VSILTLFPVAHLVMQQELRENTNIIQTFFHINAAEMLCVFLVGIRVKDGGGEAKYRRSTFSINCTGKSPSCCMLLHDFLAHPSSGCNY